MALAGPLVQAPSPASRLVEAGGAVAQDWQSLFAALQRGAFNATRSGPTADRPTSVMPGRWIGMAYYDTTLGKPVFLHSVNPDVWHDGSGAVV